MHFVRLRSTVPQSDGCQLVVKNSSEGRTEVVVRCSVDLGVMLDVVDGYVVVDDDEREGDVSSLDLLGDGRGSRRRGRRKLEVR